MSVRHRHVPLIIAIAALLLTMVAVPPAQATIGDEGCTPGYWKNHMENWPSPYAAGDDLDQGFWFFGSATWLANHDPDGVYASFASDSLHDTLQGGGGRGLEGATTILLRAGTAALLNTTHGDVAYFTVNRPEIVRLVNRALQSGDRGTILELADRLDRANNGGCPL